MKIESEPKDIEELTSIKDFMAAVPQEIEKIQVDIKQCMNVYDVLNEFHYKFPSEDDYEMKWNVFGAPKETLEKIEKQRVYLDKKKEQFIAQMQGQQTEFQAEIGELEGHIQQFSSNQNINEYEEVAGLARSIHARIQECVQKAKTFNHREMLVQLPEYDYQPVFQMVKDFQQYYNLWTTVDKWRKSHHSWLNDDFEQLNPQEVEETVETSNKTLAQAIRFFRDKEIPGVQKIAEVTKGEVEQFQPYVELVGALRKEGMKERHWQQISEKVGFEVKPYEGFTFNNVIEMGLPKYTEECADVGERASKEYNIECQLANMKQAWENVFFLLKPFKNTGSFTIATFEEAMALLDEHIVLTQTMQFSPHKKPFEEEIEEWNTTLQYIIDVIEQWKSCQGQWSYLQPIFDSPDIMRQLPLENKRFKSVNKTWVDTMNHTKQNPNILKACTKEGLLQKLQEANANLDVVQRGLKEYLESKRSIFARFYFLSNDELLEILSQTKEVENVRPHLRKVFENMADLKFMPDKTIVQMKSGEKEEIDFVDAVDPRQKGVEYWMGEVERMMQTSVRYVLLKSIEEYKEVKRTEWIKQHPGQCVLNGSQVHWTQEVEEAIKSEGSAGVSKYFDKLSKQLLDTVELVR